MSLQIPKSTWATFPLNCLKSRRWSLTLNHPHYLLFIITNRLRLAESNLAGPRLGHADNFKSICLLQNAIERSQGAEIRWCRQTRKYANTAWKPKCRMANVERHTHTYIIYLIKTRLLVFIKYAMWQRVSGRKGSDFLHCHLTGETFVSGKFIILINFLFNEKNMEHFVGETNKKAI